MSIRVLSREDILKAVTMTDIIAANRLAMKLYAEKAVDIPLRTNLNIAEHRGQSLYMPGYAAGADALGLKIVSVYPDNPAKGLDAVPGTMVLLDPETGIVNCLMDGTTLTQLRTGAISGLASDYLANKSAESMLLIGTGGQAETQLEAVLAVRELKQVYVAGRDMQKTRRFAEKQQQRWGQSHNLKIEAVAEADEVVGLVDIVTTVTTATSPTFSSSKLKPGAHVNGVGSYIPEMIEVDADIFKRAELVYVDTWDAVTEAGDFQAPLSAGVITKENITGELGQLILDETPGRRSEEAISFFKSTGNAVLDIVAARVIYEQAEAQSIGKIIEL